MPEHVKVKSTLTNDLQIPIEMSVHSVEIYVDGVPHMEYTSKCFGPADIFVGSGTHNFQARFSETRDSENIAMTYTASDSAIQTITVTSRKHVLHAQIKCEQGMDSKKMVSACKKTKMFLVEVGDA